MDFDCLAIDYDDRVLTPRRWTARQSDWAAELAGSATAGPLLELCSGAGHIGLLAARKSGRALVAVDANPAACEWARHNAKAAGVDLDMRCADLAEALEPDESFAVVIADPPWVEHDRVATFSDDPVFAIDGGVDGLDVARLCLDVAAGHLTDDGVVLLQLGSLEQLGALVAQLEEHGLRIQDHLEEPDRGVVALLSRSAQ